MPRSLRTLCLATLAGALSLLAACKEEPPSCDGPSAEEVAAALARDPAFAQAVASALEAAGAVPRVTPAPAPPPEPPPAGEGDAEQAAAACKAATALAAGGNTALAVGRYAGCAGPSREAARAAIDASAMRAVIARGCAARADAAAAARVGATGALRVLQHKRCA